MRRGLAMLAMSAGAVSAACDEVPVKSRGVQQAVHRSEARHAPWFQERGLNAGLRTPRDSGHRGIFYFPESISGGGGFVDLDGDGWLDIYVIESGHVGDPPHKRPPNRLYRNDGDGTFTDITEGSGADDRGYGMGLATGDYDNDGDVDMYVTNLGPNVLLNNDGRGRFANMAGAAGVDHDGFGASCAFLDYDADGWLDLFVANYVDWSVDTEISCTGADGGPEYCNPRTYQAPTADVLYHNNGDGTFSDVTRAAGMADAKGNGLGVVCGDFNGDGRVDIFVANDATPNRLWINLGEGRFRDEAMMRGCAIDEGGIEKAGMGTDAVDYDFDGDLDLLVVNLFLETDSLYRNEGRYFADVTAAAGLAPIGRKFTRFGAALVDFNHDGRVDIFESNGKVARVAPYWSQDKYAEPNVLMRGLTDGRFEEVQPRGGTAEMLIANSRAAAFGDVDNDGAVDVLVINREGPVHLLRNVVAASDGPGSNWIMFRVLDDHGRDAIGATVTLKAGERTMRRDVRTAYSYLAANDPRVHFGIGNSALASEVAVRWADGAVEVFGEFKSGQIVTLRRHDGTGR